METIHDLLKRGKFWTRGPMVVTGCSRVSDGCLNCWAEKAHVMRAGRPAWPSECLTDGRFNGTVHFNLDALKKAVKSPRQEIIIPWNDPYHEGLTTDQIHKMLDVMYNNDRHIFLLITKRIERAVDIIGGSSGAGLNVPIPDHIWHIATVENQPLADERIPLLFDLPGKRGLIIEPFLGGIVLPYVEFHCDLCGGTGILARWPKGTCHHCDGLGKIPAISIDPKFGYPNTPMRIIHQVILGGETGVKARPMTIEPVRKVRDQCEQAGVPFYFKQWGRTIPASQVPSLTEGIDIGGDDLRVIVNKSINGRLLDGREHNELAWVK